jgi:hypothetical protein
MTRELSPEEWKSYFDRLSHQAEGTVIRMEVLGDELGDQIEMDWLQLDGITYDPKGGILDVIAEGVDARVARPKSILIDEREGRLVAMQIVDADDDLHVVRLKAA